MKSEMPILMEWINKLLLSCCTKSMRTKTISTKSFWTWSKRTKTIGSSADHQLFHILLGYIDKLA